jgi:hypothetical protein
LNPSNESHLSQNSKISFSLEKFSITLQYKSPERVNLRQIWPFILTARRTSSLQDNLMIFFPQTQNKLTAD